MILAFLLLTFGISLAGFACIAALPAARSPERLSALPFWLLMVWGPTLSALILSAYSGELTILLTRVFWVAPVPIEVWLLCAAPLGILFLFHFRAKTDETPPSPTLSVYIAMVGFNLILGPLGEELGWRGYFHEHLEEDFGWIFTSLLVGVVWFVWHLPLWMIDTPHAQIDLRLYGCHVMLYSVTIGGAYSLSGGSVLPAILIHLSVNLAANWAVFLGFQTANGWFKASLVPYAVLAAITGALAFIQIGV